MWISGHVLILPINPFTLSMSSIHFYGLHWPISLYNRFIVLAVPWQQNSCSNIPPGQYTEWKSSKQRGKHGKSFQSINVMEIIESSPNGNSELKSNPNPPFPGPPVLHSTWRLQANQALSIGPLHNSHESFRKSVQTHSSRLDYRDVAMNCKIAFHRNKYQ